MILLIDNYGSFSYNLVQLVGGINSDIQVIRNDELTVPEIEALQPSHIILSPGPGYPQEIGEVMAIKHEKFNVYGVQFNPESILTPLGHVVIQNFLELSEVNKYDQECNPGSNQR